MLYLSYLRFLNRVQAPPRTPVRLASEHPTSTEGKSPGVETIGFGFLGFLILSPGIDILDAKKKAPHAKGQLVRLRGVEESESFFDEMSFERIVGVGTSTSASRV